MKTAQNRGILTLFCKQTMKSDTLIKRKRRNIADNGSRFYHYFTIGKGKNSRKYEKI